MATNTTQLGLAALGFAHPVACSFQYVWFSLHLIPQERGTCGSVLPRKQAAANRELQMWLRVFSLPDPAGALTAEPHEAAQALLAGLQLLAPAHSLCHSSTASEYYRTSQKYAQQTTGLKLRENTFPLLTKVGEDSVSSGIALLAL